MGQTDDFNDGDDSGWSRQNTLGIASYGFPDGAYRITAPESPNPGSFGPSRAASLRQDISYDDRIFLTVDLIVSDPFIQQAVGFLAFVQPGPAPGMTSGYSLSYQPLTEDLVLNRIVNELPIQLDYGELEGAAGSSLRLVLIAEDGEFSGAVYNLDDLVNPIARVSASDSVYSSGTAGIFVFSDTDDATGPVDATFDNYRANPITLPELKLTLSGETGFQLQWPDWAVHFSPKSSIDLTSPSWDLIPIDGLASGGGQLFHSGDRTLFPKRFFRLERRPL